MTIELRRPQPEHITELGRICYEAFRDIAESHGFPPDFLARAFERFSRPDSARTRGGAGLGLSIVRAIAEAHGGSTHTTNVQPHGADVHLALPRRADVTG